MKPRVGQLTHAGIRLRAAIRPTGSDSRMPANVAITAICRLSAMPLAINCQRPKFGGNMRARKRWPCSRPAENRSALKPSCEQA